MQWGFQEVPMYLMVSVMSADGQVAMGQRFSRLLQHTDLCLCNRIFSPLLFPCPPQICLGVGGTQNRFRRCTGEEMGQSSIVQAKILVLMEKVAQCFLGQKPGQAASACSGQGLILYIVKYFQVHILMLTNLWLVLSASKFVYPFQAPWILSNRPPVGWPKEGIIQFVNFQARYRPDLDLALRDVTFQSCKEEKVTCQN